MQNGPIAAQCHTEIDIRNIRVKCLKDGLRWEAVKKLPENRGTRVPSRSSRPKRECRDAAAIHRCVSGHCWPQGSVVF